MIDIEDKTAGGQGPLDQEVSHLNLDSDVLSDLRDGWLETNESVPKRKKKVLALWGPDLGEPLLTTQVKKASPVVSVKVTIRRIRIALLSRFRNVMTARMAAGESPVTMFALLAVLAILGALFYTTAVNFIFDAAKK